MGIFYIFQAHVQEEEYYKKVLVMTEIYLIVSGEFRILVVTMTENGAIGREYKIIGRE